MKAISDDNFAAAVADGVSFVQFKADWCNPCVNLAKVVERVVEPKVEGVDFYSLDIDDNPSVSMEVGIKALPTLAVYKDGELVDRMVGVINSGKLIDLLNGHASSDGA